MIENKKIKKLEKVNKNSALRFKKSSLKPYRAQVGVINKPLRTCEEKNTYLMESDLIFAMEDNKLSFDISMLNNFKFITSAEIRKDLTEKVVTLLLEPHQNPGASSSWQNVANDLAENDDQTIKEWVDSLRNFGGKYEKFLQEYAALKKEASLQKRIFLYKMREQSAAKRLYLLSSYPAFEMRYRMRKEEIQCTELCFNETFLRETGYTLENFTSTVLSEGLPQFFPQESSAIVTTLRGFMDNYMTNETELPEQEAELLMKTGYRKKMTFQAVTLVELSETDLILSLVFFMKTKSQPFGNYQKQPYSPEFLEILKKNDKEKEYLFNHYYGEKFLGLHSNTEKVCRIKEIPPPITN